jgi:hypothetical protein
MMVPPSCVLAGFVIVCSYVVYRLLSIGKRDARLPPGPPTVPVLGNAHLIPTTGIGVK